jgi:hypothetical protein
VILWRRAEPRFRKVVRPEQPLEKVYCRVAESAELKLDSPCRKVREAIPRLYGVYVVPDRTSRIHWVGDRFSVMGGTYLLWPATLRPGACTDDKGNSGIAYLCTYPDLIWFEGKEWVAPIEEKYFRLRDDVEEVGHHEDKFGHPIYIVRNKLGETFRLAGVYARIYHTLREKGGWVKGEDLLRDMQRWSFRFVEDVVEFASRRSESELEELMAELVSTLADIAERVSELQSKLIRGRVDELPPPGTVPADLERLLAKYESLEFFNELYTMNDLAEKRKHLYGGDADEAFAGVVSAMIRMALGLLIYEALIVEMGIV